MNISKIDVSLLPAYIDHTLLKPDAVAASFVKLCEEACFHGFYSVCVNSQWVAFCKKTLNEIKPSAKHSLDRHTVKISAVCGFPLGANHSKVKTFEAVQSVMDGAAEIDMVLAIGSLITGDYRAVQADIKQVVDAVEDQAIVKVIFETGFLNEEQKRISCELAEQAGAHFVKTSTGFGPGGATVEDIRLMRRAVSTHIGVKASGGIRDLSTALQMIEAGATRLGTSAGIAIVQGITGTGGY